MKHKDIHDLIKTQKVLLEVALHLDVWKEHKPPTKEEKDWIERCRKSADNIEKLIN